LNFNYQYWDCDERYQVVVPLESFNDVEGLVYMILALEEEVSYPPSKRHRIGDDQALSSEVLAIDGGRDVSEFLDCEANE